MKTGSCMHGHGRMSYWIEGEGFCDTAIKDSTVPGAPAPDLLPSDGDLPEEGRAFRFCRMFNLPAFEPPDAALVALGEVMSDPDSGPAGDASIPAGFTYLGQFIDHDITRDQTAGLPTGSLSPEEIIQGRSPALDLDSVYGRGPVASPELYEADGLHFRVGRTNGHSIFNTLKSLPNDLPRQPDDGSSQAKAAIIGDLRNDENFAVAQTHLAFLKLHNRIVDQISGGDPQARFEKARKATTQHYQSVVLHDFLPRLVDPHVYQDVLGNGRRFFLSEGLSDGIFPGMPVEFSVAAYRHGHSMIRNQYEWNRVFSSVSPKPVAALGFLFDCTQFSGNQGKRVTLPSDWIIDWTRFVDFEAAGNGINHPISNRARRIDSGLANGLKMLPEFLNEVPHLQSLAIRNLLRGRLVGLPSGQDVAREIGAQVLSPDEVRRGRHAAILEANDFHVWTPLWYYILKEAEVRHGGQHLGEVGSRIVVETLHGLIETSRYSILKPADWEPTLPSAERRSYSMADLLTFVGDLNPLGAGAT